jgi:DNA-binding NarL/FixJ family response regulator
MRGESLWTPEQRARIARWREEVARVRDSLTEREREVLHLVADGLSNKEIAQALTITVRTTDFQSATSCANWMLSPVWKLPCGPRSIWVCFK